MSANMKKELEKAITDLYAMPHVKKETLEEFSKRIEHGAPFTKEEYTSTHFCSFFLPYNALTHSVYVVHHKKANDWIPPGGHLDPGESPLQTVVRECKEELSVTLEKEPIRLINASITDITQPQGFCTKHYDFWYAVATEKLDFSYDKGEFYDAGWYELNYVWRNKTKRANIKSTLQQLSIILPNEFK
ncbi:MAG: NUDIX domain-containing protein [Candidatus Roizmanbacteria bacterium]|nr:NUDIX domain-containing protein [Candidatus Roizmanbacteria bacterium]